MFKYLLLLLIITPVYSFYSTNKYRCNEAINFVDSFRLSSRLTNKLFTRLYAKRNKSKKNTLFNEIENLSNDDSNEELTQINDSKSDSSANDEFKAKIKAEIASPLYNLRQFIYAALIAGGGLGTITAIPQLIRVLSNKGEGEVLTNAVNNVIIDAGAVVIGAAVWFYENKKQNEKLEVFKDKEKQLSNRISVSKASEREIELSKLPIEIQVSEYNETSTSIVSLGDLQSKGRQHVIIVAGEREIVKDAVISARIEGSDLFNSKDTLVIPLVLQENEQFDENIGKGFGNKEGFLSAPYIGKPTQPNVWQFYLDKEVQQAIKQGQLDIVTKGLVLAIRNDGKIIRRGIGLPPWKEIVEEFTKKTK